MRRKMPKKHNDGYKRKYYTLDDGRIVTLQELAELTNLSSKTLWLRLKKTRDYKKLSKPSQKTGNTLPRVPVKTAFQETYGDMPPKLFKLLFGKW